MPPCCTFYLDWLEDGFALECVYALLYLKRRSWILSIPYDPPGKREGKFQCIVTHNHARDNCAERIQPVMTFKRAFHPWTVNAIILVILRPDHKVGSGNREGRTINAVVAFRYRWRRLLSRRGVTGYSLYVRLRGRVLLSPAGAAPVSLAHIDTIAAAAVFTLAASPRSDAVHVRNAEARSASVIVHRVRPENFHRSLYAKWFGNKKKDGEGGRAPRPGGAGGWLLAATGGRIRN